MKIITRLSQLETKSNQMLLDGAREGNFAKVKEAIKSGANVNTKNKHKSSPLHLAALHGHIEIFVYLIEEGANPHAKNFNHNTPLHYAVMEGHLKIVVLLIEKDNANVNVENKAKNTPLHYAAINGNLNVVKYLVRKGANLYAKEILGSKTPRDWAHRHPAVVRYLKETTNLHFTLVKVFLAIVCTNDVIQKLFPK